MMPIAHVAHALPGRVRLQIPSKRGDARYFARLRDELASVPGVLGLRVNPRAGSALITHAGASAPRWREVASARKLFSVSDTNYEPKALWQRVSSGMETMDARLKRMTRGDIDLRSILFLALVIMGIRQAAKQQVMAPALTLLWYGTMLVLPSPAGETRGK